MSTYDDINNLFLRDKDKKGFYSAALQDELEKRRNERELPKISQAVGVVPEDIANHNPNNGMEQANQVAREERNKPLTYEEMLRLTTPQRDFVKEKEELGRKRKRDATFAAIGDALSAMHRSYAYSRGIKPLSDKKDRLKDVEDKYDKLFDDLDTKNLAYMREKMNAMRYDQQEQNRLEELKFNKEQAQKAFDYQVKKDEEAKEERKAKEKQSQDNWQAKFDAEQKDKEERRNSQKEHYERQDRNAANRNANSGKKQATTGNGKKRNPMSNGKKKNPMN